MSRTLVRVISTRGLIVGVTVSLLWACECSPPPPAPAEVLPTPPAAHDEPDAGPERCAFTGTRRFLGPDPSLMLLALDSNGDSIELPETCAEVDRTGETWIALGPLGEVVTHASVTAMDRYEPYEGFVQMEPIWSIERERIVAEGSEAYAIALFAASDAPAPSAPTTSWSPEAAEHVEADAALDALAAIVSPTFETHASCMGHGGSHDRCVELESHWLFFRAELHDDADHDGAAEDHVASFALGGSRDVFAIFVWDAEHRRFAVDGIRLTPNEHGSSMPIGAIDVDGNGFPEVILRTIDLTDWSFTILRRVGPGRWDEIASGAAGSTA